MTLSVEVAGSNVRDFCMLERNYLSHFKLVLLLILLCSSALLGVRLPGPSSESANSGAMLGSAALPVSILQLVAALATIAAAFWEYQRGIRDLLKVRAFLGVSKVHFPIMVVVTTLIVTTSILYLVYSA